MQTPDRYRLTFTHGRPGAGAATDEVVVERTASLGPGGNPVYCDPTGILRAEISPAGEVRMLASGGYQSPRPPSVEPLP
ncbi:DUF6296 family protein [Streptomyces sp. Qhu-G9]|uniref:DUF6296 family protein n=1 Tax=Streptomyces sp. Qhu-G9 TaxID=3452799 RepID=UPI0022AC8AE4|nr:DUF6296 family protein [Streptomyces aurantiacus]WAU83430.1 DUF6296 family protein [Streptomyces aurantiacus]